MNIGRRINRLRIKNNMTLDELASRTELTKGFISQLERDLTSPSIATLGDIAGALGISLAQFFQEDIDEKIVFSQNDFFIDEKQGSILHWIVPNAKKNAMEPLLIEVLPHQSSFEVPPHGGEEFGYVLSGKLRLVVDGKETPLKKGQTFYLKGANSHHLRNDSDSKASVVWVSTPPIF
jgi:transcriptional regulator with XRE-family HTH domain